MPRRRGFADHSIAIVAKLEDMVELHREEIEKKLARHHRHWADVLQHLTDMERWAQWCLDHQGVLNRKTIKLEKEERVEPDATATREAIFARVERVIDRFSHPNWAELYGDPAVMLLVAPTGSRKSTMMRTTAVRHVTEHHDETVVVSMPRHRLGDEQIDTGKSKHAKTQRNPKGAGRLPVRDRNGRDPDLIGAPEVKLWLHRKSASIAWCGLTVADERCWHYALNHDALERELAQIWERYLPECGRRARWGRGESAGSMQFVPHSAAIEALETVATHYTKAFRRVLRSKGGEPWR